MITFHPLIPIALWLPLALAAVGLLIAYGVMKRGRIPQKRYVTILGLMSATFAVPLLILLNATWVRRQPPPPGKPLLTVLIDRSGSMATEDGDADGKARFAVAQELAADVVKRFGEQYDVRLRTFAETSAATDANQLAKIEADGKATDLGQSIEKSLGEDRPAGQAVLVLSDGIETSGGSAARLRQTAERARALSTPLFVKTIGTDKSVRDLQISLYQSQELAFAGQQVPVVVRASHSYPAPQKTTLSLSCNGEELESREVTIPGGDEIEALFYVDQEKQGLYRYELAASAISGEVTSQNNQATLLLRVVNQPVSVLLLEGKPYWDTKFLIRTLSSDPSVKLTSVVQLAPGRFLERQIERPAENADADSDETVAADPTAPQAGAWKIHSSAESFLTNRQFLSQFQIVVLGRSTETYLTDEALIELRSWLADNDRALVCFRGAPASQLSQRLGSLMPVSWASSAASRSRVALTESGKALQWLPQTGDELQLLPSLASSADPAEVKPLATVLATSSDGADGEKVPLITYRPEGSGRVVVIEGAGMWRWAFLSPEHQAHDAVYGKLWRSLVRWLVSNVSLMPHERVALRPDSIAVSSGQNASATLILRPDEWDSPPQVELSGGSLDKPQSFAPQANGSDSVFRVHFGKLPPGRYVAKTLGTNEDESSAVAAFDVRDDLRERLDVAAQPHTLSQLAEQSGGSALDSVASDELPAALNSALIEFGEKNRPQRIVRNSAWNRWWVLTAVIGLWGCTWGIRRWSGLL
ncbi:vWA domain-containing protein [Blastopirellula marina]|uniref:VWFA domain-containing protein n=1 Tax=Blastopirellula marina TaxID=124 RepID=A0A2S8FA85_9BACT|nr:vWA domain-containing protein [Blastopirellula marina]PQO29061.1 hypothetical protein C5Y98_22920 [Blastopirellula marina]PTL42332.1 hypothetical protein C5Y97_22930 [Blastopirellula marina]